MRLVAPRRLEEEVFSLPAPGDGEILCQTVISAISPGTEIASYTGMPPLRPGPVYPRLQGYCNVARILETGKGVTDLRPGDRVLTFQSHRSHFVVAAADILARIDDAVDSDKAAVAYLFHLGYNAVLRSGVRPGHRVLVIGLGALGLTSVALAAMAGANVCAVSDHDAPRQLALKAGAATVLSRDMAFEMQKAGELSADIIISTTGSWTDWQLALKAAASLGVIAVLGFPGRGQPAPENNPLDSQFFYMKQLRIEAVGMSPELPDSRGFCRFNERSNLAFILKAIELGTLHAELLISGRFPGSVAGLTDAYESLLARRNSPVTFLLDWSIS